MSERSLGTLRTSALLFLGGFLLMGLLASLGTLGGSDVPEEGRAVVEAADRDSTAVRVR